MNELMRILEETCPGVDFTDGTALIDDGILTSLDIVTIVSELMEVFEVEISVDDLVPEHVNTVQAIWELFHARGG